MNRYLKNDYLYPFCNNQKLYQILLHKKIGSSENDSLLPKCLKFRKYYFKTSRGVWEFIDLYKIFQNVVSINETDDVKNILKQFCLNFNKEKINWINKFTYFEYLDIKCIRNVNI